MITIHEAFTEAEPAPVRVSERFFYVCRPAAVRLLAQHVLAGLERPKSPRVMQAIRQGHVDGIDSIVGEEIVIAAVRLSYPPSRRERFGATCVAARDGDDLDIRGPGGPWQHLFVDERRREHSPVQRFTHCLLYTSD